MDRPVRIGLTQRVEDLPDRGERRDALDQKWAAMLAEAGHLPVLIPNRLPDVERFVALTELDLLILTGGNDLAHLPDASQPAPERDRTEAALLDLADQRALPVLGVCRGLQLMVDRGGGSLTRVEGHVARPHAIALTAETAWPLRDGRTVNSFHGWGVLPGATGRYEALAAAPDGTVEAVAHPTLPQVGIMWHPEREPFDRADLDLVAALAARSPNGTP